MAAVAVVAMCAAAFAQQTLKKETHPVTVDVTGINNHNSDGVTRVLVRLTSMPNTSSRVDSVSLITTDGKRFLATDIDGVDFKRYFQWEENGQINVEVDFPHQKKNRCAKIVFHTVYGDFAGKFSGGKKR